MLMIACRFSRYCLLLPLFLLLYCQQPPQTGAAWLQKTLAYHDPGNKWSKFKAQLFLSSTNAAGKTDHFQLEFDNKTGYFAHISRQDGKEVVKGMADGAPFFRLDGKSEISPEDQKKYKLTPESVRGTLSFYGYLYGLPMKLQDKGAVIQETVTERELGGRRYPVLQVTYDPAVGKDNWFFYLHPQTYALQAYQFNHGKPESGEYILLEEEVQIGGLKLPKVRKWYWNKDQSYIGTDVLLRAEPLVVYRNR